MPDYAKIKLALGALSPPVSDPAAAAAALNAQMVAAPYLDVPVGSITGILLMSASDDWDKVNARAVRAPVGDATDALISLAKRAVFLMTSPQITIVHSSDFPGFAQMMGALVQAGDISTGSQQAILLLAQPSPTVPAWMPPLTAGDMQTAMAQP